MEKTISIKKTICCTAAMLAVSYSTAMALDLKKAEPLGPIVKVSQLYYKPAPAKAGSTLTLGIKVDNTGKLASGDKYNIHLDCKAISGGPCPITDSKRPLPSIAAGSSHNVTLIPAKPWPAGKYKLSFSVLDPSDKPTGVKEMEIPVEGKIIKRVPHNISESSKIPPKPGTIQGFNPQPEPPARPVDPVEKTGINPQPEPPGNMPSAK